MEVGDDPDEFIDTGVTQMTGNVLSYLERLKFDSPHDELDFGVERDSGGKLVLVDGPLSSVRKGFRKSIWEHCDLDLA